MRTTTLNVPVTWSPAPIEIRYTGPGRQPTRGHHDDAGLDLYCYMPDSIQVIGPGEFVDVACGLCIELPPNVFGFVTGRSSTLRHHDLLVATGIIDPGYRGPLFAGVRNLGDEPHVVHHGDRLAQLIPLLALAPSVVMEHVEQLAPSARGESGFGSTGR